MPRLPGARSSAAPALSAPTFFPEGKGVLTANLGGGRFAFAVTRDGGQS